HKPGDQLDRWDRSRQVSGFFDWDMPHHGGPPGGRALMTVRSVCLGRLTLMRFSTKKPGEEILPGANLWNTSISTLRFRNRQYVIANAVSLPAVFSRCDDLEVPRHMEAAHRLSAQRDDVIDLVFLRADSRFFPRLIIDCLDLFIEHAGHGSLFAKE